MVTSFHLPTATPQPVTCEVCGTHFETRRGLSSHARLHLRQLGVALSESSGAPIDFLYQLVQKSGGFFPEVQADSFEPGLNLVKNTTQQESKTSSVPDGNSTSFKSEVTVMAAPSDRLKASAPSLLPSSPSPLRHVEDGGSSSLVHLTTPTKPLWAPLETDAPISLGIAEFDQIILMNNCKWKTEL